MTDEEPDIALAATEPTAPPPPTLPEDEDAGEAAPPEPILTPNDLKTIELQLETWRQGYKSGDRNMRGVQEYALSKAIDQIEALEADVRQAVTAPQLKDAIAAHIEMSNQVSDMLERSGFTESELFVFHKRLRESAMVHMMACDAVAEKPLKMSDRRSIIKMAMKLRAIVTSLKQGQRR